ncbi:hypothetical protein ACO3VM_04895 [Methanocaldococcus sp. 10A]
MVIYIAKVVKVNPIYRETNNPIEAWVVFELEDKGISIETFHIGSPIAPEIDKEYKVNFEVMTYDLQKIDNKRKND